jgi:hypothetical protein
MGGLEQVIVAVFSREEKKNADRQGCGQERKRGKEKRGEKKGSSTHLMRVFNLDDGRSIDD